MTHLVPVLRPVLGSPFRRAGLYRAAGEIPSWHIAPVRTGTVTDLITGSQIITFTNSSPAWGFNSSGVLVQPSANVPFIEYDPATGSALGWRLWDGVTNRFVYSAGIGGTGWSLLNATATQASATDPSGGTAAALLVENSALGTHYARQSATITAGETITLSVFAQPYATGSPRRLMLFAASTQFGGNTPSAVFNLQTQTVISAINCTASLQSLPGNRFRCSITPTVAIATTGSNAFDFRLDNGSTTNYTGDGVSGLYLWGAQLNTGATLAPYVPTGALTASSTADVASITGAAFAGIWNPSEATLFADFTTTSTKVNQTISIDDGTSSNRMEMRLVGSSSDVIRNEIVVAGSAQARVITIGSQSRRIAALAMRANDFRIQSGSVGLDNTVSAMPVVDRIRLNYATFANGELQGYIRELAIWKSRRPNANLQAMTQ